MIRVLAYDTDTALAAADGVDVTESVRAAYDMVINSMDWGSGFLDHEEEHLIYDLGKQCAGYWHYDYEGPCKFEGIDDD